MKDNAMTTTVKAVLTPFFWSMVFPLSKIILRDIPPMSLVALRYAMGAAFLAAVARATGGAREMRTLLRGRWVQMAVLGFFAVSANASQVVGLNYVSTALGSIISATAPVYAALLAALVLREQIGVNQILGLALALGGVSGIALTGEAATGGGEWIGVVLMLFGAIAYAIYTVLGKKWEATSVPALAVGTALGVIPFLLVAALTEPLLASATSASLGSYVNLLALVVLPTGISVIWYFSLVSRLGAARASAISYLVPVFGVVQSSLLLGERLTPALLLGGWVSIAGVALAQCRPRALFSEA